MLKAYKYRIYPNNDQESLLQQTFGCTRWMYNRLLSDNNEEYKTNKKSKINTPAKYKKEFEWLKDVDSMALCNAQMQLQSAFSNFFRRLKEGKKGNKLGFPKFRSKHSGKKSYTTNCIKNSIRIENKKLKLPKLGLINIVLHRYCVGQIKSATVTQNPNRKYYVSILTEQPSTLTQRDSTAEKIIGIDMSMSNCAVLSDGTKAKFQRFYRLSEKRLAKAQRRISRKVKGSNNRDKAKIKAANIHEKTSNQRKDFINKLSYRLAENYDIIVIEDINLSDMAGALKLGKSVHDIGFGMLRIQLEYKLKDRLKTLIKADKWFASSQLCSICGYKNVRTKDLSVREWDCPKCKTHHDRDVNAGQNLVNWYKNTVAQTGIYAHEEPTSASLVTSKVSQFVEVRKVAKQDLASPCL